VEDGQDLDEAPLAGVPARAHALLSAPDHAPAARVPLARPARGFEPPGAAQDLTSDLLEERVRRERATRRAWKAAGIAFGVSVLLGLPASLGPVSLLLNGTGAVLYGFPVGYLARRRRLGVLGGGALGALAGALYAVPLALLLALFLPGTPAASWAAHVIRGALSGLVSGAWAGRRAVR
jgi:hypothetical protein